MDIPEEHLQTRHSDNNDRPLRHPNLLIQYINKTWIFLF